MWESWTQKCLASVRLQCHDPGDLGITNSEGVYVAVIQYLSKAILMPQARAEIKLTVLRTVGGKTKL